MKSIRDMKVLNLDQIRYGGSAVSGLLSVGKMIPCREENSKRTHVLKPLQEVCYKGKGSKNMAAERMDVPMKFVNACMREYFDRK